MENKNRPPALDIAILSRGKPELVTSDLKTDLPYDSIIDNLVFHKISEVAGGDTILDEFINKYPST